MSFEIKNRWRTENPIVVVTLGTIFIAMLNFASIGVICIMMEVGSWILPNYFVKFELNQISMMWAGGMISFLGLIIFFEACGGHLHIGKKSGDNGGVSTQ